MSNAVFFIDTVKKLRKGEVVNKFDKQNRMFTKFQLNRQDERVCWQRWTSLDRRNWVCQNQYLSIRDIVNIMANWYEYRNGCKPQFITEFE